MKLLAIESSGLVASAAVFADDTIVAEFTVNNKQTHSQTLLPMIDQVVTMSGIDLKEIDAIATTSGPGSFTGLRIGAATAKGLGLALHKPIVPITTLEALAFRLAGREGNICPMMDARRNQVYAGVYRVGDMLLECVTGQKAVSIEDYIAELNDLGDPVTVLGDGVPVHREALQQGLNVAWQEAPAHMNRQSAASVAVLGARYYDEGKIVSAEAFRPDYLRKSQAEREREARLAAGEKHIPLVPNKHKSNITVFLPIFQGLLSGCSDHFCTFADSDILIIPSLH